MAAAAAALSRVSVVGRPAMQNLRIAAMSRQKPLEFFALRQPRAQLTVAVAPYLVSARIPIEHAERSAKSFAAGLVAGGAGSIVGMGGAFVSIPALTSRWIALSQHQAQANSLASVLATGVGGAASFALAGAVSWPCVLAVGGAGTITGYLGARMSSKLPGYAMKSMLGVFLIFTAGAVMSKPALLEKASGADSEEDDRLKKLMKLAAIGCGVGIFAGFFGVGGGAITVPALAMSMPEMSHHETIGTSCAAMVPSAISGLCRHAAVGTLVPSVALPLAVGTSLGAFLSGRYIALQMDEQSLKSIFSVLLAVLGVATCRGGVAMRRKALQTVSNA